MTVDEGRAFPFSNPWTMGDRFRKAREWAGLDQSELAAILGVSRATVSHYENGVTTRPVRPIVTMWAIATGTTTEWLLKGQIPPSNGPPPRYEALAQAS